MESGINVEGTKPETIAEIGKAIALIMQQDCDQATIQVALNVFPQAMKCLPPVNIYNNMIYGGKKPKAE